MSKKLKVILTIFAVTVITGGVAAGVVILLPKLTKKHADLGMTKTEVLKKLGDPDHTSESGDFWYYFESKVGKKYKEKDELEHTWNEANQIKAQSIGLELETEHFESKTIHFNKGNIVTSYFYNTDTKYTYEDEKFSSWAEKSSTEITTDFPSGMKCYINSVNKDGINHYLIVDDNFKNSFNYEAMFEDKSLIKCANETFFDVVGPKNNINVEWKYDDLKLSTKINFKVYDARVVGTTEAKNVYISGNGLYNIGDNVELRAEISPGYISKGWDTDVFYSFGTRTGIHLTDDTDYSFKIQDYGMKEFEFLAEIENYTITYNLHGGINSSSNPSSYNVENNVTFVSPSKNGCTFLGWYDSNGNKITSIPSGTIGNLNLDARWEINNYHITYNLDGGTNNPSNPFSYNIESDIAFESPTKTGYTFLGWYDGNGNKVTSISPGRTGAISLTAHWEVISYSITYILNGGTNNPSNPSSYNIESDITFEAPTKTGYEFLGWLNENDDKVLSIPDGTTGDLTLSANWTAVKNNLSVSSDDISKGTVSVISGKGYFGEQINVLATPIGEWVFKGWYHDSTKVSNECNYTFDMPNNDYSLVAQFYSKEEEKVELERVGGLPKILDDGKTISYGLYPQKNVNDESLVSALNALSSPELNGWYFYSGDYYAKVKANPLGSAYKFDNGDSITSGTTYWFKCEPIVWNILENNSGEYYVLSSLLLDKKPFYFGNDRTIDGQTIYGNNYKYSDIRSWLNDEFYNVAFALGNKNILTTTVDNSSSTTDNSTNIYACDNTEDKVFLPSYQDYTNTSYGFTTSTDESNTRQCRTTDWARAKGVFSYGSKNFGHYWSRSPFSKEPDDTFQVLHEGIVWGYRAVDDIATCVRPALTIKIS